MKRLPWILLFLTLALVAWLALAIVHAENQRNALYNKACPDHSDAQCLALVESRAHWWNHLAYALTHLRP
ncbi:hypothetical protein [Janthinobacterium agaricidamnosum]|uniref:Uncharacterized protein n=1 Tax=Janthinobacterium agaricidamnosum NBRC 102515 = DSM 9628 TaxID=1349767 RepID=W0VAN8_9BURK|nr:hypothetical protein [Janthinobacterium agaricidamnosum]CDG84665.1 hypothetical protein GJA_4055 [Janthinobacterium agaricidamnosum NBRC 102515 = DSM 9628]